MENAKSLIVQRMHQWGNALFERSEQAREAEVREFWTEDGAMIVNGEVKCAGIGALTRHFAEIRAKLSSARVQLPYLSLAEQGSAVAVRYLIDVKHADGAADRIHVGAFFEIEGDKIKTMNEVVAFEKRAIELDRH